MLIGLFCSPIWIAALLAQYVGTATVPDQEPEFPLASDQLNETDVDVVVAETGTVNQPEVPVDDAPLYVVPLHVLEEAISTVPVDAPPIVPEYLCQLPKYK